MNILESVTAYGVVEKCSVLEAKWLSIVIITYRIVVTRICTDSPPQQPMWGVNVDAYGTR